MANVSPHKMDSPPNIVSLLEALTSAKKELDSQGNRVKHLEELLKQERRARENAEERARHLLDRTRVMSAEQSRRAEKVPTIPSIDTASQGTSSTASEDTPEHSGSEEILSVSSPATSNLDEMQKDTEKIDASTSRLQERLATMVRDMDEMKAQMEKFKQRAETAEGERTSLAEMVERIRQQNEDKKSKSSDLVLRRNKSTEIGFQTESNAVTANGSANTNDKRQVEANSEKPAVESNGTITMPQRQMQQQLQTAMAAALSQRDDRLMQSAPYESILGVVLIGVGIMTYLNGWQKVER